MVYQKFTVPDLLARHSFLHGINISELKIRSVLKTIHDTYELENAASLYLQK